jgi:Na+/H+ antiporter NhaD/arsenite permease-like protein
MFVEEKMSFILGLIYIAFTMVTMFLLVKDKKNYQKNKDGDESVSINSKYKKVAFLIVLCTMLLYYIIGCIFKTDILNAITLRKIERKYKINKKS